MATGAAASGSGMPAQRLLATDGVMKVTRVPLLGPKHRSPCHAIGFSSVPQPERRPSAIARKPRRRPTASISSSRVSGPSAIASRTTPRSFSIVSGVTPK